jgi:hypothetical protein
MGDDATIDEVLNDVDVDKVVEIFFVSPPLIYFFILQKKNILSTCF